jgi:glycosyltransferase involved in cell wall biosynthesis
MNQPKVSIIMSFYNENITYIKHAIQSILTQTYQNLEFIIVSDNPNNIEAIKYVQDVMGRDNRIIFLQNESNFGLVYSLNLAIRHASGEYIARMDADDVSVTTRIEEQVQYMEKHKDVHLLGTEVELIDENSNVISSKIKKRSKKEKNLARILRYGNVFIHPSIIIRKATFDEIGYYREIKYAEDYDLILRMLDNNKKIAILDRKLLRYRIRSDSISRSKTFEQNMNAERLRILYKRKKLNDIESISFDQIEVSLVSKINVSLNKLLFLIMIKTLK